MPAELDAKTLAEKRREARLMRTMRMTNPTSKDFTHSYDGVDYTIQAYGTKLLPWKVADLLAKHLAMRIILDRTGGKVETWDPVKVNEEKSRLLAETEGEGPEILSDAERTRRLVEDLNKESVTETNDVSAPPRTEPTKAEIMAELDTRNVKYNVRDDKATLLKRLMDSEQTFDQSKTEAKV